MAMSTAMVNAADEPVLASIVTCIHDVSAAVDATNCTHAPGVFVVAAAVTMVPRDEVNPDELPGPSVSPTGKPPAISLPL
jgi:hypothetical protein